MIKNREQVPKIIEWLASLEKHAGWKFLIDDLKKELDKRQELLRRQPITDVKELGILRGRIDDLESLIDYPARRINSLKVKGRVQMNFDPYK